MSKNHFEQLIEYVINDEEAKAKELFHQIVVEKSRAIYEELMDEDNAMGEEPTEIDTDMSEGDLGGSQAQDMSDDVEAEEQGMAEDDMDVEFDDEAEQDGKDMTKDLEDEHDDGEKFTYNENDLQVKLNLDKKNSKCYKLPQQNINII